MCHENLDCRTTRQFLLDHYMRSLLHCGEFESTPVEFNPAFLSTVNRNTKLRTLAAPLHRTKYTSALCCVCTDTRSALFLYSNGVNRASGFGWRSA